MYVYYVLLLFWQKFFQFLTFLSVTGLDVEIVGKQIVYLSHLTTTKLYMVILYKVVLEYLYVSKFFKFHASSYLLSYLKSKKRKPYKTFLLFVYPSVCLLCLSPTRWRRVTVYKCYLYVSNVTKHMYKFIIIYNNCCFTFQNLSHQSLLTINLSDIYLEWDSW